MNIIKMMKPTLQRCSNSMYSCVGGTIGFNYDAYLEVLYNKLHLQMIEEENDMQKDIETFGEEFVLTVSYT